MKTRYFAFNPHANTDESEYGDIEEVTKDFYDSIVKEEPDWKETEERHTVFQNGVNQVCFTVMPEF